MEKRKNGETWGANPVIEAGPSAKDPVAALGAAVLKRAVKEAKAGDLGACEWLAGDFAGLFCDLLELDHVALQRVARQWLENPAGRIVIKFSVR